LGDRHLGAIAHIAVTVDYGPDAVMGVIESDVNSRHSRFESDTPRSYQPPRVRTEV